MKPASPRIWSALVHYPVLDKEGNVVTTSVTNMDVHDMARMSRTFGLQGFILVTPIEIHREMVMRVVGYWQQPRHSARTPSRAEALRIVRVADSIGTAAAMLREESGSDPDLIGTSARRIEGLVRCEMMREEIFSDPLRPRLVIFGTGWGLAPQAMALCSHILEPIEGAGDYRHLSVRSAAAIILDRLLGKRGGER